jgi:hypothetical protein
VFYKNNAKKYEDNFGKARCRLHRKPLTEYDKNSRQVEEITSLALSIGQISPEQV